MIAEGNASHGEAVGVYLSPQSLQMRSRTSTKWFSCPDARFERREPQFGHPRFACLSIDVLSSGRKATPVTFDLNLDDQAERDQQQNSVARSLNDPRGRAKKMYQSGEKKDTPGHSLVKLANDGNKYRERNNGCEYECPWADHEQRSKQRVEFVRLRVIAKPVSRRLARQRRDNVGAPHGETRQEEGLTV